MRRKTSNIDDIRDGRVTAFAKKICPFVKKTVRKLQRSKADDIRRGKDRDWPWCALIGAYATFQGSKNWEENISGRANEFRWGNIKKLSSCDRNHLFHELPNPRFRTRVAKWAEKAFQIFRKAGGPTPLRAKYRNLKTAEDRIEFLRQFPGIGQKYARNIPMDICDELVCNHFALDHRLKTLIKPVFRDNFSYREGEEFLRRVASHLGVDARTLDRALYQNYDALRPAADTSKPRRPRPRSGLK